jgi:predicted dehydrogenase
MADIDRRSILLGAAAGALSLALPARSRARIIGANDRLRVAVMGVNGRGSALMAAFAQVPNCEVTHLIDVDAQVLPRRAQEFTAQGRPAPKLERDYRRLLAGDAIDALVVATPDHWHVKASLDAIAAGRHVYVEKPLGIAPAEGEALVAAQRGSGCVVQMGNQQRSSRETRDLLKQVRAGLLGDLYEVQTWYANSRASIGRGTEQAPPAHLDWELWQGPRPRRPYRSNLHPYNWHWFWHWGTGEICNNALHELDLARWFLDVEYPERVSARGGRRFHTDDDWEMYDTLRVDLVYPDGRTISWDGQSCNGIKRNGRDRGVLLYGTRGSALLDRNGYEIFDLAGKSLRTAVAEKASATTNVVGGGALDVLHAANFADTIRGRGEVQASPVHEGHISTNLCHLGNMAYRTGESLAIDTATGRPRDPAAMRYWSVEYAPGWGLRD